MRTIPWLTVWSAEQLFFVAPKFFRFLVDRYTAGRILACVVGGSIPMLPRLEGGDAILYYPLPQCVRYELLEYPELAPVSLFDGRILAMLVPEDRRCERYHLCGYDARGKCYDAGTLTSHAAEGNTRMREGVVVNGDRITWDASTRNYLTSFLMVHAGERPVAAGYSQRKRWRYPDTTYLPHVVLPPDGTSLDDESVSVFVMIVDQDAWVSEILIAP